MTANVLARMLGGVERPRRRPRRRQPLALAVYGDALAPGWIDWSYRTTNNFAVSSPVYSGRALPPA
ncbi:MAG: hypothetical protein U0531_11445 [Dehalococcoidia bacterium]